MAGRYIFRNCVPDGAIDIVNVTGQDILRRSWSFRVNEPPDFQELIDQGVLDPRNILRGNDGELYDLDGNFLAEVNEWQAQYNVTNTDYQPGGKKITWAIPTGYTVTLTFQETIIRDAILLKKLADGLRDGVPDPVFNFMGVIKSHRG
mgnify:FL=1